MIRAVFFDFVTHYGGAQRSTVELIRRLATEIDIEMLDAYGSCVEYKAAIEDVGIPYQCICPETKRTTIGMRERRVMRALSLIRALPGLFRLAHRLRRYVRESAPDLVWTNSRKGFITLVVALVATRTPVLYFIRGGLDAAAPPVSFLWLVSKRAAKVLTLSHQVRLKLIAAGIPENKIAVVPNAADEGDLLCSGAHTSAEPLPQISRQVRILVPGTLVENKGQVCAVESLKSLVDKGMDVVMYLAGDVPPGAESSYYESLQELVHTLGVQNNIEFLGWRRDLISVIERSSVVVLPSQSEGVPRVVLEAMVLRRPVVATPVGGVTDLVVDTETGWLVPVNDPITLAERITEAVQSRHSDEVVERAYVHVKERFSPKQQIAAALSSFLSVVEGRDSMPESV